MANEKKAKYTLVDDFERTTTRSYGTTGAVADVETFAGLLDAVSDLGVKSCGLNEYGAIATPAAPPAQSSTDSAACVICNVTGKDGIGRKHKVIIPAPKSSLFETDGKTVDITNGSLLSYLGLFASGGDFRFADGSTYDSVVEGYKL